MEDREGLIKELRDNVTIILHCIGLLVIFCVMVLVFVLLFSLIFSVELSLLFGMLLAVFCMIYGENIIACIEEVYWKKRGIYETIYNKRY